jgi:type I restriction enzyme, S subunit
MGDWIETTIGAQAALQRGFDITKAQQRPGSVPVVSSGGVTSWHDEAMVEGPGVILGRKGVVGSVHRVKGSYWPHDTTLWVKDFHGNNRTFVYYFFRWLAPQLAAMDVGSANPTLNRNHVHPIKVRWPSLALQARISSLLESLDDKIELNRQTNETLEALARAIFKGWFVDFGPTRAKAEGRAPYLAPALWDLLPDRLDAEGKPEGWQLGDLSDCIQLQRGFDLPAKQRRPGKYEVIAAGGPHGMHDEYRVRGPGVVTGRSGVIGNVFLTLDDFWPLNTTLWVKEFRRSSPAHAYFLLGSIDLVGYGSGSAVPTLNRNHVHMEPVVLPPVALLQAYSEQADLMFSRIQQSTKESQTLAQTRDLLLPKLMSGEIRLRDAEQALRY